MTMTDQQQPTSPAPKKTRKPARKRAAHPVATAAAKPSEMDGITVRDCPIACNAERCAISATGICAHPCKGGLQPRLQTPDAMRRFNQARRIIGNQKLDLTTT